MNAGEEEQAMDEQAMEEQERAATRAGNRRRTVRRVVAIAVVAALVWWWWPRPEARPASVRVAAVGAVACASHDPRFADGAGTPATTDPDDLGGWCRQAEVGALVTAAAPDALLGLGDYVYEEPRGADYRNVYDPAFGGLRGDTWPAIGNQEYKVHEANTFHDYFAGVPDEGWYSYSLGQWHAVVLNSNCDIAGGCDEGSPQYQWLAADLAAHPDQCVIAYWHHPRWSTGLNGSDDRTDDLWRLLATEGADVVLTGHEHDYERFEPLDADGLPDPEGVTSFVVGTGGQAVYAPDEVVGGGDLAGSRRAEAVGSAIRIDDRFGALFLTLDPDSFSWQFVDITGTVVDDGTAACSKGQPQ